MKGLILMIALLLAACGSESGGEAPAKEEAPFDKLTDAAERAKAVEQQIEDQKERLDRALEESEQPPDSARR